MIALAALAAVSFRTGSRPIGHPGCCDELVSAGKVIAQGDRLTVPLILETGTYVAAPGDTDGD